MGTTESQKNLTDFNFLYLSYVIFKTLTTIYKQVIITHSKINKTPIILSNTTINYKLQKDQKINTINNHNK